MQIAVAVHFTSKQLLLFVFELQDYLLPTSTGILTAVQRQTAVTAHFTSEQLLLIAFTHYCTGVLCQAGQVWGAGGGGGYGGADTELGYPSHPVVRGGMRIHTLNI